MGIVLTVFGIIVTIVLAVYFGKKTLTKKTFKNAFPELIRKVFREELKPYLDGLPDRKQKY